MDELSCSCLAKAVAPTGATDIESYLGSCSFRTQEVEPENQDTLRINSYQIGPGRLSPQRENNKALRHQVSTLMTEITGSRAQTLSNVGLNG